MYSLLSVIDKLEFELDVSLFERRKGLITPTPTVQLLRDEIERAYVPLEALKSFSARLARGDAGKTATSRCRRAESGGKAIV
ncbi:hypothetical protein [Phyllobacterium zundukense]|uniref:HTH lysR-type domain-containing protein n=1 Tax=Phyllobacterium zundukense TaxID=1867719 RepID=A0A2N9W0D4_9HYPH|nr:hypothetical protein [Phyllobacterium zundukense]ATU90558.1 hypothetical protein BLM14_01970 [Phyllobacterium zundukense]PIO45202.1 hypothetical protein B5P45_09190 [Phyllobacterium zundukense]